MCGHVHVRVRACVRACVCVQEQEIRLERERSRERCDRDKGGEIERGRQEREIKTKGNSSPPARHHSVIHYSS